MKGIIEVSSHKTTESAVNFAIGSKDLFSLGAKTPDMRDHTHATRELVRGLERDSYKKQNVEQRCAIM